MATTDLEIIDQLLLENVTFKNLHRQHAELDQQLNKSAKKIDLKDSLDISIAKRKKLHLKDQMVAIIEEYRRVHNLSHRNPNAD